MNSPQIGEAANNPVQESITIVNEVNQTEIGSIDGSRLKHYLNAGKRALQGSVIAIELLPTNEAIRFGAYAAALTQTQSPLVGAVVLGGTTLAVEGAAALAAASVLDAKQSNKSIDWINSKVEKLAPNGVNMTPPVEAGAALLGGSAVVLSIKQIENPKRTLSQNRRHGMFTAGWMSAYFATEGALFAEGVDDFSDPKKIGGAFLALGGLAAVGRMAKKHFKKEAASSQQEISSLSESESKVNLVSGFKKVEIKKGLELDEITLAKSITLNDKHRDINDEAIKIGLYGDDVKSALTNPGTIMVEYINPENDVKAYLPLLVPVESLEWYNIKLLKERYGENSKVYYFAHPPTPSEQTETDKIINIIQETIKDGSIVIYDYYPTQTSLIEDVAKDSWLKIENLGRGLAAGEAEVFSGVLNVGDEKHIVKSPGLDEVYEQGVKNGEFVHDTQNGITLETVISDEVAEKVWKIYEPPFERLSKDDGMYASLDKKALMDMLKDPAVMKILNRNKGEVTTLCFFTNEFKNCPWFNPEYYKTNYPEYYDTKNIFMFPGIVTGDSIKGQSFSLKLIDFAVKLAAKRGTDTLITFECSPISKMYIPRIVRRAINKSGVGTTNDFTSPISTIGYKVLTRKDGKHDI